MSYVKLSEITDGPQDGEGVRIHLEHPFTMIKYDIGLFQLDGKIYAITDKCKKCGGSLARGTIRGRFAFCNNQECGWNLKSGVCKFDRSSSLPTYKVSVQEDGYFINL